MKRRLIGMVLVLLVIINQFVLGVEAAGNSVLKKHRLSYASSPADNPLRGFVGYRGAGSYTDYPYSMEYVVIKLSDIVVGKNKYNWTPLEKGLKEVASYGRHSILSFYMDMPGKSYKESGIPGYLLKEGLKTNYYWQSGGGYSPDYSDQRLWKTVYNFVKAFGKKYDGDKRIAQVEASIVGFWGEWHTHPYTNFGLKDADLIKLAKTYDKAFNKTQVSIRYPKSGTNKLNLGYSDYSFCYETLTDSWSQYQRLKRFHATDYWKKNMGGGEVYPPYYNKIFMSKGWSVRNGESYNKCVKKLHPTWLLFGLGHSLTGTNRENSIKAAKKLGYDFTVTSAYFQDKITTKKQSIPVKIKIKNIGVAPFYYNWKVKLAIFNHKGKQVRTINTKWDLTQIAADGKIDTLSDKFKNMKLNKGIYTIEMKVNNPLPNGNKLMFANSTQKVNGWLVLGTFSVGNAKIKKTKFKTDSTSISNSFKITRTYYKETIKAGKSFVVGARIRNYRTSTYTKSDRVQILVYKNKKLIRKVITDWRIKNIKAHTNHYYCYTLKGLKAGNYSLKIKLHAKGQPIEIGDLYVKK